MVVAIGKWILTGFMTIVGGAGVGVTELTPLQFDSEADCQNRIRIILQQSKALKYTSVQATCQEIKGR